MKIKYKKYIGKRGREELITKVSSATSQIQKRLTRFPIEAAHTIQVNLMILAKQ